MFLFGPDSDQKKNLPYYAQGDEFFVDFFAFFYIYPKPRSVVTSSKKIELVGHLVLEILSLSCRIFAILSYKIERKAEG